MHTESKTKFEHWGLVELMGHQRIAGLVTETEIGGKTFLRVDVPDEKGETRFTRFYSPDAVYCISPTDKQIAIGIALKCDVAPVSIYDLAKLRDGKKLNAGEEVYTDPDQE